MATAHRAVLWILLGGWIGALALFAVGVAPLAFRVVAPDQAAQIVGPILRGLNYYGMAAGLTLAMLSATSGRGHLLTVLPLVLVLCCAFSEFWVTAGIDQARPHAFGLDVTAEAARRFAFLHQLSRALYFSVTLGALALAVLHARFDASQNRGNSRKDSRIP